MATVEKMTIHKALCELKILDSRINNAISSARFCLANKHSCLLYTSPSPRDRV